MNDIGEFALLLALATALYGIVSYVMAFRSNRVDVYMSADKTPIIVWACVMVSSIVLWWAFMINDFSLQYVAAYSNIDLDSFYKFSSFWGGQKGSLLFWTLLLSTYMMVVHVQNRKQNVRLVPIALAVMMVITLFFLVLLNFSTNPFERLPVSPTRWEGPESAPSKLLDGDSPANSIPGVCRVYRTPLPLLSPHFSLKIWTTAGFA